jgi:hypothetical protein
MDTKEEVKKTLLTEPLKKLIGYILALAPPLLLPLIPQIRDLIQVTISFSQLLVIASLLLSAALLLTTYIFHLQKKIKGSTILSETENHLFNFRVIEETPTKTKFEVWYFYTGVLGTEGIYISPTLISNRGKPEHQIRSHTGGDIVVLKTKAIAKMEIEYVNAIEKQIKTTTEIELCLMYNDEPFHCQRFPYRRKLN